jgi:hypothetical protein
MIGNDQAIISRNHFDLTTVNSREDVPPREVLRCTAAKRNFIALHEDALQSNAP